jgi:hypothetical protein
MKVKSFILAYVFPGIGKQIDKMELETIASKPSGRYVFMIENFNALTTIIGNLAGKACEGRCFFILFSIFTRALFL